MKDIIINKNEDGSNLIALVENGKLIEKYDDDESIKANEGNIYLWNCERPFTRNAVGFY